MESLLWVPVLALPLPSGVTVHRLLKLSEQFSLRIK